MDQNEESLNRSPGDNLLSVDTHEAVVEESAEAR